MIGECAAALAQLAELERSMHGQLAVTLRLIEKLQAAPPPDDARDARAYRKAMLRVGLVSGGTHPKISEKGRCSS